MRRGHANFNRGRSLNVNSKSAMKASPANSVEYMPYNSLQRAVTEGNRIIFSLQNGMLRYHVFF